MMMFRFSEQTLQRGRRWAKPSISRWNFAGRAERQSLAGCTPPHDSKKALATRHATKRAKSQQKQHAFPRAPHRGPHVIAATLRTYKSQGSRPPSCGALRTTKESFRATMQCSHATRLGGAEELRLRVFLEYYTHLSRGNDRHSQRRIEEESSRSTTGFTRIYCTLSEAS
jgi:hypothetical protein